METITEMELAIGVGGCDYIMSIYIQMMLIKIEASTAIKRCVYCNIVISANSNTAYYMQTSIFAGILKVVLVFG